MNLYKGAKLESIPGGASGAKLYQVKDYFGEDIIMKVETIDRKSVV